MSSEWQDWPHGGPTRREVRWADGGVTEKNPIGQALSHFGLEKFPHSIMDAPDFKSEDEAIVQGALMALREVEIEFTDAAV